MKWLQWPATEQHWWVATIIGSLVGVLAPKFTTVFTLIIALYLLMKHEPARRSPSREESRNG